MCFRKLFDLNSEGKVDALEEVMEFDFFRQMQRSSVPGNPTLDADDPTLDGEDQQLLDATGYNRDKLELMDAFARNEVLSDGGHWPMDFGFDVF